MESYDEIAEANAEASEQKFFFKAMDYALEHGSCIVCTRFVEGKWEWRILEEDEEPVDGWEIFGEVTVKETFDGGGDEARELSS